MPAHGENVETVRRAIDAWNRQDLAGFLEAWHPDAEWWPAFPQGTEGRDTVYRGADDISRAWANVRAAWTEYRLEVEHARTVGEDLVVLGHIYVRGASSGVEIDSAWSAVVRFRDGKVISAWDWLDHEHALEAAGPGE
jgi:ketosteroid isomerase-like protein